jgi:hypothetical protein
LGTYLHSLYFIRVTILSIAGFSANITHPKPSLFVLGSVYTEAATTTTLTITPERHLQIPALAAPFKWQQLRCC